MTVTAIYCDSEDGDLYGYSATYSTARTTYAGGELGASSIFVGQYYESSAYCMGEGFVKFDTSGLPDTDTIQGGVLKFYITDESSATDFTLRAYLRDWGTALSSADWVSGASMGAFTLLATKSSVGATDETSLEMVAEPALLTQISNQVGAGGSLRIILTTDRVMAGNTPTGKEFFRFAASEIGGSPNVPCLTVTHHPWINSITQPTGTQSLDNGAVVTIAFGTSSSMTYGEVFFYMRDVGGSNYYPWGPDMHDAVKTYVPASGTSHTFDAQIRGAPPAAGYQLVTAWRSVVGSGSDWVYGTQTGSFTIVGPSQKSGTRQTRIIGQGMVGNG